MYIISKKKRNEILDFYKKNHQYYSAYDSLEFMDFAKGETPAYEDFFQLYSYFDALPDIVHPYFKFYKLLCNKYPNLDKRKILEVASGYVPAISHIIATHKKMEHPIVAMDPKAIPLKRNDIIVKRQPFTLSTDITPYDLVISHLPCDALNILMPKLVINRKEFSIQMCRCKSDGTKFTNQDEWNDYLYTIYSLANNLTDYGFAIEEDYLTVSKQIKAPVITARKLER